MALPLDVRDLMRSGSRFMEERALPVRFAIVIEVDAPDVLIDTVREHLRPATAAAALQIEVAELGVPIVLADRTDAVIALAGSGNIGMREALSSIRRSRVPVVALALGDQRRESELADALMHPTRDLIVREEPDALIDRLGAWLADDLGSKRLALAHNFSFMRRAVADDATKTTAVQNALIGTVTPIPGADMPIMTANQVKMLLQIAAAYGQPMSAERIKELAAVVAGGYLLRALARQTLTFIPVLGWAVKGGIAYTGTIAMGKAATEYFDRGADLGDVTKYLASVRERAVRRMPRKSAASVRPHDIPALRPPDDEPPGPMADVPLSVPSQEALPLAGDGLPGD